MNITLAQSLSAGQKPTSPKAPLNTLGLNHSAQTSPDNVFFTGKVNKGKKKAGVAALLLSLVAPLAACQSTSPSTPNNNNQTTTVVTEDTSSSTTTDSTPTTITPSSEETEKTPVTEAPPVSQTAEIFSDYNPDLTGINVDHWEFYTYDGVSMETSAIKPNPSEADIKVAKWLEKRLLTFYENRPDLLQQIKDPANPVKFQLFVNPEGQHLVENIDNYAICEYQNDPTLIAFSAGMERFLPTQLPESKMFFYLSSCFENIDDQSFHPTKGNFYKVDGTIPELTPEQQSRMDELRDEIRTMVETNDPALMNLYSDDINFPSSNEYDDGYGFLSMTAAYYMEFKDYPELLKEQHPAVQEAIALMDVVYGEQ